VFDVPKALTARSCHSLEINLEHSGQLVFMLADKTYMQIITQTPHEHKHKYQFSSEWIQWKRISLKVVHSSSVVLWGQCGGVTTWTILVCCRGSCPVAKWQETLRKWLHALEM